MGFKYSTTDSSQNEFDSLPRVPLVLHRTETQTLEVMGLVDSGATVSVLPYEIGTELGGIWDDSQAIIQLAETLSNQPAIPFFVTATLAQYPPVQLAFAWVKLPNLPLILGQTNFFLEFDVYFYRSKLEFEVKPQNLIN